MGWHIFRKYKFEFYKDLFYMKKKRIHNFIHLCSIWFLNLKEIFLQINPKEVCFRTQNMYSNKLVKESIRPCIDIKNKTTPTPYKSIKISIFPFWQVSRPKEGLMNANVQKPFPKKWFMNESIYSSNSKYTIRLETSWQ